MCSLPSWVKPAGDRAFSRVVGGELEAVAVRAALADMGTEAITTEGSKVVPEKPAKAQGVLAVQAETQLILNPSPGTRYTHGAALPQRELFITGEGDSHCSQQSALHMSGPQGDQETGGIFVTGGSSGFSSHSGS